MKIPVPRRLVRSNRPAGPDFLPKGGDIKFIVDYLHGRNDLPGQDGRRWLVRLQIMF